MKINTAILEIITINYVHSKKKKVTETETERGGETVRCREGVRDSERRIDWKFEGSHEELQGL